jgi:hypothetical protein
VESAFAAQGLPVLTTEDHIKRIALRGGHTVEGSSIVKFTGWEKNMKVEIDMQFCLDYGNTDYCMGAINYIDREYCELPSLMPFLPVSPFSIGNILIYVESGDRDAGWVYCSRLFDQALTLRGAIAPQFAKPYLDAANAALPTPGDLLQRQARAELPEQRCVLFSCPRPPGS